MQRVVDDIRGRIISGELGADRVLKQSSVARALNVSRIPVREAFRILAAEGLLMIEDGQGYVTPLSVAELQEIYEIREALEPLANRLALAQVGRAQVMVMEQLIDEMLDAAAAEDIAAWLRANAAFHRQIFAQSGRRRIIEIIDRLTRETDRYLWLHLSKSWSQKEVDAEHRRILDAVRAKDADELEQAALEHLRNAHGTILEYMLRTPN